MASSNRFPQRPRRLPVDRRTRHLEQRPRASNVQKRSSAFPDAAPGTNTQGLTLYCSGAGEGAWLHHSEPIPRTATLLRPRPATYARGPAPDYFQYGRRPGGPGLTPRGIRLPVD